MEIQISTASLPNGLRVASKITSTFDVIHLSHSTTEMYIYIYSACIYSLIPKNWDIEHMAQHMVEHL